MWAFISPCAFSNAVLQMQAFNAWQSPNILAHKWGGGGGPPWGEFNGIDSKSKKIWSGCALGVVFEAFFNQNSLKIMSWRAPGTILEAPDSLFKAPRLQLGRFWNDFFQIFGQNATKAMNAKNACQNKTSITNVPRVGGRRCSPPGGVSMELAPSWA